MLFQQSAAADLVKASGLSVYQCFLVPASGHDKQMVEGSGLLSVKEAVDSHSLPGYGPVISVNRPVRTRMPGGVGAGGLTAPSYPIGFFISNSKNHQC